MVLIVVVACAALGALIVYRSMQHTPESTAESMAPATRRASASVSAEQALAAFFGKTAEIRKGSPEQVAYPGVGGIATSWTATVGDVSYRAWVASRDDASFVVRVEPQTGIDASQSSTDTPSGSPSPRTASNVTPDDARRTAEGWADNFEGLEELTALPLDPGPYRDRRSSHYVFTWQRQVDSTANSTGHALLPTWVTVWIDAATGDLAAFDSLHRAAGNPRTRGVTEEDVRNYPEAEGMDEFQIMAVPKLDTDGRWKTISVWMISDSAQPASKPAYVNASDGDPEDVLYLYTPNPWSLPRLTPQSDEASPEASVVPGV